MLRLDLAQYRELAAFAQFGADLDQATRKRLARGERTVEILKQDQYKPVPVEEQIVAIFAVTRDFLDDVEVDDVAEFEERMLKFMRQQKPEVLARLRETKRMDDEMEKLIREAIEAFKAGHGT
jgi:F-type H+-transporting ATPase subunit alpha